MFCWSASFGADLREARGDHHDRPNALASARFNSVRHLFGRNDHDREVHLVGHSLDGRIGLHRLNHGRLGIDQIDGPSNAACDQVVKHLGGDRPSLSRGADDGDRPWLEQRIERGVVRCVHCPRVCANSLS
jgi:hypothetical protein